METSFSHLFSPTKIGSLSLKNRLVRSATYEAMADEKGRPTPRYLAFFQKLAEGGAGLIVTGFAYPEKKGSLPRTIGVDLADCVAHLSKITDTIKAVGNDCKIMLQICHIGRQPPHGMEGQTVAPSPIREPFTGKTPREMTLPEIEDFIDKNAAATLFAKQAGFDAVQVHAAHGWLLSSFLSPHTNRRRDQYGGDEAGRTLIMTEIVRRARSLVGDGFPIMAKVNAHDYVETGIELSDSLRIGLILQDAGYDALEISSGMWETITRDPSVLGWKAQPITEARKRIHTVTDEAYHREFARAFKNKLSRTKVILVGGLKTPSLMEEIIASGDADLVSLSRPLIREPDLPNQWQSGSRKTADCNSCNKCLKTLAEESGLRCYHL